MAEDGAAPSLKKGGGHGWTGGFGYLFQEVFEKPFIRALKDTMDGIHPPAQYVFDEVLSNTISSRIMAQLKENFVEFRNSDHNLPAQG
jgi:hypothetical protein